MFIHKIHSNSTRHLNVDKTLVSICILSIVILFTSCSKDKADDAADDEMEEVEDYYFTVKIDGVNFSSDTTPSVSTLADQTGFYNIQGNADNGDKLTLTLVSPTATGTIQVSDDLVSNAPNIAYYVLSPFGVWAAGGTGGTGGEGVGTIVITENNATYMEGTFSFTGANPVDNNTIKEFTEGRFKAKKF